MKRNSFSKRYLNTQQAAEYVGVSYNTFVRRVKARKAPQPDYNTPRLRGWKPVTLDAWLEKLKKSGKPLLDKRGRRRKQKLVTMVEIPNPGFATMQAIARAAMNQPEDKTGARNLGDAFTQRFLNMPKLKASTPEQWAEWAESMGRPTLGADGKIQWATPKPDPRKLTREERLILLTMWLRRKTDPEWTKTKEFMSLSVKYDRLVLSPQGNEFLDALRKLMED